jgi:hypothetical protein
MLRFFSLIAIIMSTVGGCRSASTVRNVHGIAGRDAQADPAAVTDYRGEEIRLTKRYDDYDDFKNDPNNIAPEEYDRVRKLVETAPVPERCADAPEVVSATFALKFPGYGLNGVGDRHSTDSLRVLGTSIEIPHANANRYIIYLREDPGYRLVDDTVLPEPPYIDEVTVSDGKVTYLTREETRISERPIRSHADR